jgi:hypothetical protein
MSNLDSFLVLLLVSFYFVPVEMNPDMLDTVYTREKRATPFRERICHIQ